MEDNAKLQAYGDITIVTGKYMKDGKEKNRYQKIGVLFATPHFSRIRIKLDALPLNGDGWLNVFKRESKADVVVEDIGDEPINLNDIPF
jgi:hypothetical protein